MRLGGDQVGHVGRRTTELAGALIFWSLKWVKAVFTQMNIEGP